MNGYINIYEKYYRNNDFDVGAATTDCIRWIQAWFNENGPECRAVVGISGGKDSSVTAALCAKALGKQRVLGVLMPNGVQLDIDFAEQLVKFLKIPAVTINISGAVNSVLDEMNEAMVYPSNQTKTNLPARIRMSVLYAVSQSENGRVANTCNFSEDWVGYSTRYGDAAGDFAPLSAFTVTEVKEIGRYLGLPFNLVDKPPSDGLSGLTDEDNLGFTYSDLDRYIRFGVEPTTQLKAKIDAKHIHNIFKMKDMGRFGGCQIS